MRNFNSPVTRPKVVSQWIHNGTMKKTVTLSVKGVPADLAKRLKDRAERNHRSLQGELRAILEQAGQNMTFDDLARLAKRLGMKGESGESARMIREDRDDPRR
jgi:antitoxin FitA